MTTRATLDGVLNVRKAAGWTSHDVVAKIRGVLGAPRVGHAGTLDPAATGVLPILVGRATRIAEYLLDWDKEYRAVLRLGETTDTLDATGTVLARRPVEGLTEAQIREAFSRFQGVVTQVPPMYSAVKVGGVPLYKAARAGRTVERGSRDVTVHRLEILDIAGPEVTFTIACSKGTYIRTLCADVGEALGVGGHLLTLVRTRVGPLRLEDAVAVEGVAEAVRTGEGLLSVDRVLEHLPATTVDETEARRVVHGVAVSGANGAEAAVGAAVRIKDRHGVLIALGTVGGERAGSRPVIQIRRVLVDAEGYAGAAPREAK
jgi:tRNA pseudouridine55 synthase